MNKTVKLREVIDDDLETFFEHQQEPEANRMAALPARTCGASLSVSRTGIATCRGAGCRVARSR